MKFTQNPRVICSLFTHYGEIFAPFLQNGPAKPFLHWQWKVGFFVLCKQTPPLAHGGRALHFSVTLPVTLVA